MFNVFSSYRSLSKGETADAGKQTPAALEGGRGARPPRVTSLLGKERRRLCPGGHVGGS